MGSDDQVRGLVAAVLDEHTRIDSVVNAAGVVLASRPEGNRTDGDHGSSVVGLASNVLERLRRREPPSDVGHEPQQA